MNNKEELTALEALERLIKYANINEAILITKYGYSALNDINCIKQDLNKLKELEEENESLRNENESLHTELKRYRNLENKIGIDLIILFSVLNNGAWVKSKDWGICHWTMPNIWNDYNGNRSPKVELEFQFKKCGCYEYFKVKDYGKTWALTREELEDVKN